MAEYLKPLEKRPERPEPKKVVSTSTKIVRAFLKSDGSYMAVIRPKKYKSQNSFVRALGRALKDLGKDKVVETFIDKEGRVVLNKK